LLTVRTDRFSFAAMALLDSPDDAISAISRSLRVSALPVPAALIRSSGVRAPGQVARKVASRCCAALASAARPCAQCARAAAAAASAAYSRRPSAPSVAAASSSDQALIIINVPGPGDPRHEMEMQRRLKEAVKDLAVEIVAFGTSSDPARRPAQLAIAQIHATLAVRLPSPWPPRRLSSLLNTAVRRLPRHDPSRRG
jgi:hypothetical protein